MNSGLLRGIPLKRMSRKADAAKVLRGDGDYVTLPVPSGVLLRYNGGIPPDTLGSDGDWCISDQADDRTGRSQPAILFGPKVAGAWSSEWTRTMPTSPRYMSVLKGIASNGIGPVVMTSAFIECWAATTPVVNPFTAVGGTWTSGTGTFGGNTASTCSMAVLSSIQTPTYEGPGPVTQVAVSRIGVMPTGGDAVGCGSLHPGGAFYGYSAWADASGRLCLGKTDQGLVISAATYLTATGTGVLTTDFYIVLRRLGTIVEAFALNASGILIAGSQLSAVMDGTFDGLFGLGPAVIVRGTTGRLRYFGGMG